MVQWASASRIITPQELDKLTLRGMGRTVPLCGVMDETEVNVMIIGDGARHVVICVLDTVFVDRPIAKAFHAEAERLLPGALCMVSCIHDHSASAIPADADNPEHCAASDAALQRIIDQGVAAIQEASANLSEYEIATTRIQIPQKLGTNRRAKFNTGTCTTAWGAGPVVPPGMKWVDYSGPDADWIDLLAFKKSGSDSIAGMLTSYGSHIHFYEVPMVAGEGGGVARSVMREKLGIEHVLYTTAYAGDVSLQFHHPMPAGGRDELIEWQRRGSDAFASIFTQNISEAISDLSFTTIDSLSFEDYIWNPDAKIDPIPAELGGFYTVQTVKLGQIALIGLPGEMFLDFDRQLRSDLIGDGCACKHAIVMGYNFSWLGYVATPMGFEEGSYETMRGPSDTLGYDEAKSRMKGATTTGSEIINKAREHIQALF